MNLNRVADLKVDLADAIDEFRMTNRDLTVSEAIAALEGIASELIDALIVVRRRTTPDADPPYDRK